MSLRVLIVDDEPLARGRLRELLAQVPDIHCLGDADGGAVALDRCAREAVDVVLLDIRMPGMDGLATAHQLARLPAPPAVIFLTAYDDRAIEAFDAGAIDYLLKPVRRERLEMALQRVGRRMPRPAGESGQRPRRHFAVRAAGRLLRTPVETVVCLRAEDKYVNLVCADGHSHLIEDSLTSIEREFADRFVRIHRNCLVAADRMRGLERQNDGSERLLLEGLDESLDVSRRNLASIRARLLRGG